MSDIIEQTVSTANSAVDTVIHRKIRTGDLLVWSYDSLRGWYRFVNQFIQMLTLSSYSHVGIAIVAGQEVFVVEATRPEIKITPISNRGNFYVVPMNIPDQDDDTVFNLAKKYVGKKYSIVDCIRAYFGWKVDGDERYQCAELCVEIYRQLGIKLKLPRLTPREVVNACLKYAKTGLWYY